MAWKLKPIEIDDVPIVVAALRSSNPALTVDHELRQLAEEIEHDLQPTVCYFFHGRI